MDIQMITKKGMFISHRGKTRVNEPMFDRSVVFVRDHIMVYNYDTKKHHRAEVIENVSYEKIIFKYLDKPFAGIEGDYTAATAHRNAPGMEVPHVYMEKSQQ